MENEDTNWAELILNPPPEPEYAEYSDEDAEDVLENIRHHNVGRNFEVNYTLLETMRGF